MGTDNKSCVGCKYLFADADGYSDWTWMETQVTCALNKNPNLPKEEPIRFKYTNTTWEATENSRCANFAAGPYITISPDGFADQEPVDEEQRKAIEDHRHSIYWSGDGII